MPSNIHAKHKKTSEIIALVLVLVIGAYLIYLFQNLTKVNQESPVSTSTPTFQEIVQ